jgi:glycosyltransferase involved in cell wall biosynthesis
MSSQKKALIAFLGNINYDTRCNNLFKSLEDDGYDVNFIGFDWLTENFSTQKNRKTIYKLHKGSLSLLFYLKFITLLKWKLFTSDAEIFFAEDIYTLPFVSIYAKIKRARVIYDSRELYGYLAGLKNKKLIQKLLQLIEKLFIKKANHIIVTGKMDADFFKRKYGLENTIVIRNLPVYSKPERLGLREKYLINPDKKILIYQGVILHGRGLQPMFKALQKLEICVLIILGSGEYVNHYKKLASEMNLRGKVIFAGKVNQDNILAYTRDADIGLSLIENISLSYYYALPNKLFEYIMAEIPVIVSNLPQMKEIVENYNVGFSVDPAKPDDIVVAVKRLTVNSELYNNLKENCLKASAELNWENEIGKLLKVLK